MECLSQFHLNMLYFVSVCDTFESTILSPLTCGKHHKPRTHSEKSQVVVRAHGSLHNYSFYCQLNFAFCFIRHVPSSTEKNVTCQSFQYWRGEVTFVFLTSKVCMKQYHLLFTKRFGTSWKQTNWNERWLGSQVCSNTPGLWSKEIVYYEINSLMNLNSHQEKSNCRETDNQFLESTAS